MIFLKKEQREFPSLHLFATRIGTYEKEEIQLIQGQNQVEENSTSSLGSCSNINVRTISDLLSEYNESYLNFCQW